MASKGEKVPDRVVTYPRRATDGNEQDHGFGSLNVHSIGNAILRQAAEANEELRKNMTANISEFMRSGATLHRGGATLPQGGSLGALGRHGATLPSRHGRLYQTGINEKNSHSLRKALVHLKDMLLRK